MASESSACSVSRSCCSASSALPSSAVSARCCHASASSGEPDARALPEEEAASGGGDAKLMGLYADRHVPRIERGSKACEHPADDEPESDDGATSANDEPVELACEPAAAGVDSASMHACAHFSAE